MRRQPFRAKRHILAGDSDAVAVPQAINSTNDDATRYGQTAGDLYQSICRDGAGLHVRGRTALERDAVVVDIVKQIAIFA